MVTLTITEHDNLLISLNDKEELETIIERGNPSFADILDNAGYLGNGWELLDPEEIGALTEAPIIGLDVCRDEQDEITEIDSLWWFPAYEVIDPFEKLLNEGEIIFIKGV